MHAAHAPLPQDAAAQARFIAACMSVIHMHAGTPAPRLAGTSPERAASATGNPVTPPHACGATRTILGTRHCWDSSTATVRTVLRHHGCTLLTAALLSAPAPPPSPAAKTQSPQDESGAALVCLVAGAGDDGAQRRVDAQPAARGFRTPAPTFRQSCPPGSQPEGSAASRQAQVPLDSPTTAAAKAAAAAAAAAAGYGCGGTQQASAAVPSTPPAVVGPSATHAAVPPAAQRGNGGAHSMPQCGLGALTIVRAVALSLVEAVKHLHKVLAVPEPREVVPQPASSTPVAAALLSPCTPVLRPLRTPALAPPSATPFLGSTGKALVMTVPRRGAAAGTGAFATSQRITHSAWPDTAAVRVQHGATPSAGPAGLDAELFQPIGSAQVDAARAAFCHVHMYWNMHAAALLTQALPPSPDCDISPVNPASVTSLTQSLRALPADLPALAVFDQWLTHVDDHPVVALSRVETGPSGRIDRSPQSAAHSVPAAALFAAVHALTCSPVAAAMPGFVSARQIRRCVHRVRDLAGHKLLESRQAAPCHTLALAASSECVLRCACVAVELLRDSAAQPGAERPSTDDASPERVPRPMRHLGHLLHMLRAVPAAVLRHFEAACAAAAMVAGHGRTAHPDGQAARDQANALMADLPPAECAKAALLPLLCGTASAAGAHHSSSTRSMDRTALTTLHCAGLCVSIVVAFASLKAGPSADVASTPDVASAVDAVECVVGALEACHALDRSMQPAGGTRRDRVHAVNVATPPIGTVQPPQEAGDATSAEKALRQMRLWLLAMLPAALECLQVQLQRRGAGGLERSEHAATRLSNFLCSEKVCVPVCCIACVLRAAAPRAHTTCRSCQHACVGRARA